MSEIADTFDVSRQAVYDNIRRTGDLVEDYETKLGLYRNFEQRQKLVTEGFFFLCTSSCTSSQFVRELFDQLIKL